MASEKKGGTEPVNDIRRDMTSRPENLTADQSFRFSSVVGHIKKNWLGLKSLNKKT